MNDGRLRDLVLSAIIFFGIALIIVLLAFGLPEESCDIVCEAQRRVP